MKKNNHFIPVLLLLLFWAGQEVSAQKSSLYSLLSEKSWTRILEEDTYKWRPPYTVNLLIQPVHSPDWLYVNPSMVVSRRRVTENVSTTDPEKVKEATSQEDLVVQFAFDEPAFLPDFRLTRLHLEENKYPVATADYFANDIYYQIEYVATSLTSRQTLLCLNISATNEGDREKNIHIRTKVGYYSENQIFDYHYIPYRWTAAKWKPYDGISMENHILYKKEQVIGKIIPGQMEVGWEKFKQNTDGQYEEILYPQVWYGSGYALPEFRVKEMQDVIHASKRVRPGESTGFSIKLLVDDRQITSSHKEALARMSPEEVKSKAIVDFKKELSDQTASLDFQTAQWSDIFTELQLNTLQLLVKYPDKDVFMPSQGSSSERFYVWVFEAVQMLRPLLRTGQFEAVKRSLDYIFALQDAGYSPVGRFTTTEGAIGTTGPRWANTTGMALALASDYYLYSKDSRFIEEYLPKILKALHWISGEVAATRKMNPDGSRPLTYGLMPFAVASDGDQGYFVSATDVFSYWGFDKAVRLLESIHHVEAITMRRELDLYRKDLLIAIRHLSRPDGYIDRKIETDDKDMREATKFVNTDIMAPIATVGIMEPESGIFRKYMEYYENQVASDYFMGKMDRDIFYMIQCEHYWQPIYLMLGEWKKAFMTLQTCLKYGMTQDTHQTQERFSKRDPAFAPLQPNGSGNGGIIDMLLNALYFETADEVILFGGVPFEYLINNRGTSLHNLYTLTGKICLEAKTIGPDNCIITLSSEQPLPQKIRIPEHFKAKAENLAAQEITTGVFKVKADTKRLLFRLSR